MYSGHVIPSEIPNTVQMERERHKIPKFEEIECLKSQQNSPQRRNGEGWHKIPKLKKIECLKSQNNSSKGRNREG